MNFNTIQKITSHIISFSIFIYLSLSLYVEGLLTTKGVLITAFAILISLISSIFSEWINKKN